MRRHCCHLPGDAGERLAYIRGMIDGFRFLPEYFSPAAQKELVGEVLGILETNPLYRGAMPRTGTPLSVRNTNLGPLGWVSDIKGYRYQAHHPVTGETWGPIPETLLKLWEDVAEYPAPPEACLVNWYEAGTKLGLHVDADEDAKDAPVVSVSLGSRALFRLGGLQRKSPTSSMRLASGNVVVLGGASRRAYHGVDRIWPDSSQLVPGGGRINLTLRRVTRPQVFGQPDLSFPPKRVRA